VAAPFPIGELAQKGSIRRQLAITQGQKVSHSRRMITNLKDELFVI
jgi:hypothetical protein